MTRWILSGDIKRVVRVVVEAATSEEAAAKAQQGELEVYETYETPGDEATFVWDGNDPAPE